MANSKTGGYLVRKFHRLPLRYHMSIFFFFLALFGTCSLVFLAILSQDELIREGQRLRLYGYDRALDHDMELQGRWAVSLASSFARNPEVAAALARRDRLRLIQLCYPAYLFMKEGYKISQFNFHTLPARNFLRLQRLYEFGDSLEYRKTILDAASHGKEVFGVEKGLTGYGIRGVVPIFYEGEIVGTVEIGFSLGTALVEGMKKQFGIETSFLFPDGNGTAFRSVYTTYAENFDRNDPAYAKVFKDRKPDIFVRLVSGVPFAIFVRTIQNYEDQTFALVEFCVDQSNTVAVMKRYARMMIGTGILGMLLSVAAIYLLSLYFTRPIGKMVEFAGNIASGQDLLPLDANPSGELRVLAEALNDMLASLKDSRVKIKDYTENLEQMVEARTRALHESEEKYRTLVENVPLVVYRLLGNGKTIFINRFIEDLMGVPATEALKNERFWKEKVWPEDRANIWPLMDACLREGKEFQAFCRIRHAGDKPVYVLDHALPVFDENGQVETVDGFLLDMSDRHRLQQQIVQTEELRTLSEVSERLAHEIRNPLVAAGGFARRVLQVLPEDDPNREKLQIIVKEVGRLEKILERTLAYLQPFEILPQRCSLNELLTEVFDSQRDVFQQRSVLCEMSLAGSLAPVLLDQAMFKQAVETIVKSLLGLCQSGSGLLVRTSSAEGAVKLEIVAKGVQISKDDVEHFFYPFTTGLDRSGTLDLPHAKMIVHKHRGLIHLHSQDSNLLVLNVTFPQ